MLEDITKKMDITKTFDVGITQGSYWGGAQIPYWLIQILTVGFGAIGLDHLLLRSPRTAILKVLSIIPLFGFWYFFDIAQVFGEEESVRKYGFAIPFAGPQGIGGGCRETGAHPAREGAGRRARRDRAGAYTGEARAQRPGRQRSFLEAPRRLLLRRADRRWQDGAQQGDR